MRGTTELFEMIVANSSDLPQGGMEMKIIELTDTEATILVETLESSLSDLRTEIVGTDNRELHAHLKHRESMLGEILNRLKTQ